MAIRPQRVITKGWKMKRRKREISRRTKPVGAELFDASEEMQMHFSRCFRFSTVDLDAKQNQATVLDQVSIPPGTSDWITDELIRNTIETWQPYSEQEVDSETAAAILINVGELLDLPMEQALNNNSRQGKEIYHEAVFSAGTGQQSRARA
ncbi:hypothetical protein [Bremerella sp. P1]|uniref:hypothetical protein n=1 Tax=Bremerella sp. P1 TaxID=3026424 RepID=UPI0023674348|nr:hypothetical protein [Bremerella sp. P1]WDI43704.1 hypothetical protein PSR63_07060 [Bremerella sp. P1]